MPVVLIHKRILQYTAVSKIWVCGASSIRVRELFPKVEEACPLDFHRLTGSRRAQRTISTRLHRIMVCTVSLPYVRIYGPTSLVMTRPRRVSAFLYYWNSRWAVNQLLATENKWRLLTWTNCRTYAPRPQKYRSGWLVKVVHGVGTHKHNFSFDRV